MFDRAIEGFYRVLGCVFWLWGAVFLLAFSVAVLWSFWDWVSSPPVCVV